jgi:P4 family phage/plasmid primase-like protien
LDELKAEATSTGKVKTSLGELEVPGPEKAPAYWLQAEEAFNLRQVLKEYPPDGLELIAALHDETVWLTTPEHVQAHARWVEVNMGRFGPCRARWGSSWGDLDDGGAGRDRPVEVASILHDADRSLRVDPVKALQAFDFGIQYLGAIDPERLSSIAAVLEVGGNPSVVKAIRALGKQGRKSLSKAVVMTTTSQVEDVGLPLFQKGDQLELGQHLARSMEGKAVAIPEGVRIYSDETGAWSLLDPRDLEARALLYGHAYVEGKAGKGPSPVLLSANAVVGIAKIAELELLDLSWKPADGYVAFDNGALDEDGVLHPHDPANRILSEHMFKGIYDETALCPVWDTYMEGVFQGDEDGAEKISFLQEYVGACLFGRATTYQRHPMLWGPSASNGKSVFIKTIREVFPKGSLASSPPQAWSKEFGKSALLHARMNLITETPDRDIVDSGPVKAIMTGDPIEINVKYRDPITYAPVSGHIFAANSLPKVTDRSDGFFRRFVMIKFNRSFKDGVDADTSLPDKLKLEIPGIVAWAVRGYQRLKERGHLVPPISHDDAILSWKEESSSELSFLTEKVEAETEEGRMMTSQDVYNAYRIFCSDQGLYPVSQNKLGRSIREAGYQTYRGRQGRGYIIRLKDK